MKNKQIDNIWWIENLLISRIFDISVCFPAKIAVFLSWLSTKFTMFFSYTIVQHLEAFGAHHRHSKNRLGMFFFLYCMTDQYLPWFFHCKRLSWKSWQKLLSAEILKQTAHITLCYLFGNNNKSSKIRNNKASALVNDVKY